MRTFLTCLALCLAPFALSACGDDTTMETQDLSASGDSCLQVVTCAQGCAGMSACQQACAAKGSSAAQSKFQALFTCAYAQCTVAKDGGAPACSSATDTAAGCQSCVMSAAQSPACTTQLNACLSG